MKKKKPQTEQPQLKLDTENYANLMNTIDITNRSIITYDRKSKTFTAEVSTLEANGIYEDILRPHARVAYGYVLYNPNTKVRVNFVHVHNQICDGELTRMEYQSITSNGGIPIMYLHVYND